MSESPGTRRSRSFPPLLVIFVLAVLILLGMASFGSYRDLTAARQRQLTLVTKIELARQQNEELAQKIRRLQDDPAAIERLAREQYRLIRPGDVVVILPDEPQPATPAEPPPTASP